MRAISVTSSLINKLLTAITLTALVLVALPSAPAAAAGSIVVNTTVDENANNGFCSLREAIRAANDNADYNGCNYTGTGPDDVVSVAGGSTYALTLAGSTDMTGDLDVGKGDGSSGSLTIQATGSGNAIIDAGQINRVLEVAAPGNPSLTLVHITVTNGKAPDGAGIFFAGTGTLTLDHSTVSNNLAEDLGACGGGIYNNSAATINILNSTIDGNSCPNGAADGAGMYKAGGGTVTITNSTFSNNNAKDNGGGIRFDLIDLTTVEPYTLGTASITNSTFANNTAGGRGGGIQVTVGNVAIAYSTFSGNAANSATTSTGGAVQASHDTFGPLNTVYSGVVTVANSILANSTSTNAVDGSDCDQLPPGSVTVTKTLVEDNQDCAGPIASSADPKLGPLANNGGSTLTMLLLAGSPAIDQANDVDCPAQDQRGAGRPQGAHCDLGSVEVDNTAPNTTIDSKPSNGSGDQTPTFTFSGSDPGGGDIASFMCKMDSGSYAECTSPYTSTPLTSGSHTFSVYAIDLGGLADPTPATHTWTVNFVPTVVSSIVRKTASPSPLASVEFTVTLSADVTGVDAGDFALTTTGVQGASITGVTGSGKVYTVTVNTGKANGTIRLDLVDNDTIIDAATNPLGGAGAGNGNFTTGQVYTIDRRNGADTVGVFRPSNGVIYLKNNFNTGFADIALNYGVGGDYPVVGDWDGDGVDTIGVYRGNTFLLRNSNTVGFANLNFVFGKAGDQPIAGDWNNDGIDTIGVFRPSTGQFLLRNTNTAGDADISFYLGNVGDVGIAGDWNGDGTDTVGVFRPSNGVIFLKNTNVSGFAEVALNYGLAGDKPVVGDWDNDGDTTIGVYRGNRFLLRNSNTNGFAEISLYLGNTGDTPIAGNWDGIPSNKIGEK